MSGAELARPPEGFLAQYGATLTENSLALPPDLPYEQWAEAGHTLGRVQRACAWWIGDWIIHGEAMHGEKYTQAIEDTGLAPQTLQNYAHVCNRVPPARRRKELTFGHHAAVAMLPPAEQEAWLQAAEDNEWSRGQLREAIAAKQGGGVEAPEAAQQGPGGDEAATGGQVPAASNGTDPGLRNALQAVWDSAMPTGTLAPEVVASWWCLPSDVVQQAGLALGEIDYIPPPETDDTSGPEATPDTEAPAAGQGAPPQVPDDLF